MIESGQELIGNLTNMINNNTASPSIIKELAEKTLRLDLHLDPDEIKYLANRIDQTVSELEDVETIIASTRSDLQDVENLKNEATAAK